MNYVEFRGGDGLLVARFAAFLPTVGQIIRLEGAQRYKVVSIEWNESNGADGRYIYPILEVERHD